MLRGFIDSNNKEKFVRNADFVRSSTSDTYMSIGEAYSHLNNMFKAYEAETDAVKKQQQGMDAINFQNTLNAAIADPSMPYYNPYTRATNYNIVDNLKKYYNIDLSSGITQSTINDLKKKVDYSKISYNYGGSIASNTKDANQQLAYYISMLEDDEAITQKAEQELNSLQNDVWMMVQQGYSDNDISRKIDMSKYPTLSKMDEGKRTNAPLTLNRRVNYSQDYLPAYIWAARNDYQLKGDDSYVMALIGSNDGAGNVYKPNSKSYASLDPSSEYFAPYSQATTLFELGSKYHTSAFDSKWLEAHKSELLNGDSTAQKDYQKIATAVETADKAAQELEKLNRWRNAQLKGKSADEVVAMITRRMEDGTFAEDYPTLASMENKRRRGAALELGYSVDFSMPIFEAQTREMEQTRQTEEVEDAEADTNVTPTELNALRAAAGVTAETESVQPRKAPEQPTEKVQASEEKRATEAPSAKEEPKATEKPAGKSVLGSTSTAPFSVIAFKESLAGKSAVEQNTAMSNLEDEIAAYKNGTPMENLSEEAQSFISSNKELFGGRQYYEKQHYDETEKVYYDSRQNTLNRTFWNDTFTSTGVGEDVANAIQRADVGVEDGVLTPEDNAAFLIGVAEAKEKAKAAGLTLEEYLQSDKAAYDSTIGVLDETLEKNRAEMEVYQQKVQDEFVAQYSAAQVNTWNGNASDDDTRLMRQINTFNVDLSKDVVYADASAEVNDYVQELLYENGYSYEEDYSKKTAVSSWMEFGTGSASIVSGNVQQAAMSVYNEDMRAARYLGFKNLTEFYERYPELEARAQKRAEAAADEKIDEYNSAVEEFNELYQNAMQASSKGKSTVEHDGETYDVLDAIEIARNSVGQIMTEDSERYKTSAANEPDSVEPVSEEERWGIIEAPAKTAWKATKSGLVSVPLSFADAIDYYFYTNTKNDVEAFVRSNMTRSEYRAMIENAVSDESGVIPDENRRKALRTKLYGDEELGIAAYSGDIYDFGYDVSREDILKYIESREKYLQGNRDDVAKYAPGYLDGYDTMVSAVDNIARMAVVTGLTAATGGGGVASFAASGVAYGVTEGATFGRLLEDKFGLSHDKAAAWSVLYGAGITAMESFMFDKLESGAMKGVDEDNFASYGRNAVRDWIKKGSLNPSNAWKNFAWFGGKATEFTLSTLSESLQEGGEALWQNAVVSIATKDTEILPGETYTPEAFWGTTVDAIPVSAILTLATGAIGDSQLGRWAKKYEKQTAITYEQAQLGVEAAKADLETLRTKVETEGWQGIVDQNKVEEYTLNRFLESLDGIKNSAESQQAVEAQKVVEEQKRKQSEAQQEYDAAQARAQQEAEILMNEEIPSTDTIASMQDAQAELDKHADALKKENELLNKAQTTASEKQAQLDAIKQQAFNEAQAAAEQRVRQEHAEEEILQKQKRVEEEQQKVDEYLNETSKAIAESLEEEGARGNPDAIKSKILKYGENFSKYIGTQQERLSKQFANSVPGWKLQFDTFSDAGTQGYVDKNSKTIHLSNGITMMDAMRATIGHELTHILEGLPDYTEIRDAIFKGYYNGDVDKIQSDLQAIENRYNKQADETGNEGFRLDTDEKQRQELFGDLVGQVLFKADPYVINRIASQNQGVVRKIFRKISDFVKSLGIRISRDGGKEAARAYRELSRMRDTFAEALNRASGLEQQTGSVDVAGMQQVGERVEAPVDTLTAEDVLRQKAPVQEEITVEQEAPAQQEEVVAENETTNTPVQQSEEAVMTADASSLDNLKKHLEDLYKAERQEKQFTFENVNDKDVAVAIDTVRNSTGYTYFRAFTNDLNLRNAYSWLDYQVKVDTVEDYVNALKNPDVDNVVFEGQNAATMPTFYYKDGDWHVDFGGVTEQQRALAAEIEAEGLGLEYAMKSPIERTTENADYVANRDAGSRAMWEAKAEEENAAKTETRESKPQYSVRFDEDERLDALISFARDNNAADLLKDLYGKKLSSLFGSRDTRTSFEQVNPVRILKTLAANLGTQIYTADIKDDVIMGYYDQAARTIVVDENSISNLRVGLFGIGQYVYDSIRDKFNMKGVARADFFMKFAEYMTHTDDNIDPMFRSYLRSLVNEKMFNAIEDARSQIITYSSLSDVQQTMNRVRDRYEERAGKKSMRRLIRDFYINNVNAPFAANMVDRITGTDALSLAARYLPYAKRMSDSILTREYVRPDGSRGGDSFADVLQNAGVTPENQQKVFTYMLLQHEQETRKNTRTQRNKMTGETEVVEAPIYIFPEKTLYQETAEMKEIEQQIPGVKNMARSIRAWWTQFMQDWYVKEGFMPQEQFTEWQTKYANYVPHFRFGKEGTDGTVKRSKGSGRDVINPLDTYVEYIQSIVNRAQQNRVARTFHRLYQTNSSMSAIAKYAPVSGVDEYNAWSNNIQAYLDMSDTLNPADVFDNMAKMTRKKGSDGQNLTVYLENGAIVRYEITDPSLYNLLSGRDGRNLNTFARGLKRVTNTFARLTTGINPMFSVKNAIRDMQHSINWGSWASNYGSGIAKWMENFVYTADNYIKEQRGLETDEAYAQYRALGGGESERYNTRDYKSVKGLRKELLGQNPTAFETAKSIVWKAMTWEDLNNIIEMNSRLIEYRFGKQETKTLEGRKRAFMNAQEATVDFQRRGLGGVGSFLSAAIPFFNATVQGIDQQVRMFSSGERSRLGTRLAKTAINNALMGVLQVLMVGVFGDDDDKEGYSWLLDSTKNDFFLFPLHWIDNDVARGFVRLPLAQDALSKGMFAFGRNLAAGTLGEEYQDEFSVDLLKTAYDIILDQIPDTSIFSSFIDVLLNQTWYGTQMESDYKQKLSEVNRTNTNMPEFFNMLAQRLSAMGAHGKFASPIMLKYLFQQNTGVIGQFLIPMLSPDANGNLNPLRAFWTTWRNSLTLEPAYTNKVRGTYDELSTIIETTINDGNAGLIGGQLKPGLTSAEAAEAYEQALDFQNGLIKRTDQAVSQIYGEINSINANETLSASEKETLVVAKQKEIVRAQEAANDELNEWYDRYCADVSFLTRLVGRQAVISPYTVPQKLSRKFGYGVDDVQPMFEYGYDLATELKSETGTGSTQTYPNPRYKSTSSEKKPYEVSEEDRPGFDAAYIEEYETLFNEEANALEELPIEDQKKILVGIHKKAQQAAVDWYFENHTTE